MWSEVVLILVELHVVKCNCGAVWYQEQQNLALEGFVRACFVCQAYLRAAYVLYM